MHPSVSCRLAFCSLFVLAALFTRPRAADADSPFPVVPGFERFFHTKEADRAAGGQLLLGELNCTSCHAAGQKTIGPVAPKQAPLLDNVGARVRPEYLRRFLAAPHEVKPGTTMPDVLARVPQTERDAHVEALVHFLASTGSIMETMPNRAGIKRGETLFHRVGCVACHEPQRTGDPPHTTSVPLGNLSEKYTVASLTSFLRDPLHVRPSGRMPNLNLTDQEARDIASYFFREAKIEPNVNFAYFEGNWQNMPDFDEMTPKKTGVARGFDLEVAPRKTNFGIRFEGYLHLLKDGEYTFVLGSDDGSALHVDGRPVVAVPGIHPYQTRSEKTRLAAGVHRVRVDYFQGGGEWVLTADFEGPGVPRQPLASAVALTETRPAWQDTFTPDPMLVEKGRASFARLGCADCHRLQRDGTRIEPQHPPAAALQTVQPGRGCLAESVPAAAPQFTLSPTQRAALNAALRAIQQDEARPEADVIESTLTTFHCYACHERGGKGGVEERRNAFFETTIQEMGDEGRIPPPLNGVGDKLNENWLNHVFQRGANDRPYMHARMPRFGLNNVGHLVDAFRRADLRHDAEIPEMQEPEHRVKAAGRHIVGDKALSCIKCHNFGRHQATGIQALDLTTMTKRLRADWFQRYMHNPQEYRPGTRMPAAWPFGQTSLPDVLDGTPATQIRATWIYLGDGEKAAVPTGLIREAIELVPTDRPILYRNFIAGASPRAIAVGYPEKAHLAFDAERICLALIWHGAFLDASRHWSARGQGFQPPLGDHVLAPADAPPFAILDDAETPWPEESAAEQGYRFDGYRLDDAGRPTFRYRFGTVKVQDFPKPVPAEPDAQFERTLTLTTPEPTDVLWYRAASGQSIKPLDDGWYLVDEALRIHVTSSSASTPTIRTSKEAGVELLVRVSFEAGRARIVQKYAW